MNETTASTEYSTSLIAQHQRIAIVRRLLENAKALKYSGIYLSVEEVEALLAQTTNSDTQ